MNTANSRLEVPVIYRTVGSLPWRSPQQTWVALSTLFAAVLAEHPRSRELLDAMSQLEHVLPHLFRLRAARVITLQYQSVVTVSVAIRYAEVILADNLSPPLMLPSPTGDESISLLIEVEPNHANQLQLDEPVQIAGVLIPVFVMRARSEQASDNSPFANPLPAQENQRHDRNRN